jgi:hypothetical protein
MHSVHRKGYLTHGPLEPIAMGNQISWQTGDEAQGEQG